MSLYERALGEQISRRDIDVESITKTIERSRVAIPPRRIGVRGTRFVRFPGSRGPIRSIRSASIRIVMGAAIALWASVATLLVTPTRASATPTITNDTATQLVTITGSGYVMQFSYASRAIITSLQVDGHETLDTTSSPTQGTYSAVKVGSTWYTTQSLSTSPSVNVTGNVVTATLSTPVAYETWTLTAADSNVSFALARTYNAAYTVVTQGTPMLNFAPAAFDTIRWPADGGSFPVDGSLLNANAGSWLADGTKYSANTRSSKEQTSFTLLNRSNQLALTVTGSTSNNSVSRGAATELSRSATNVGHDLRLSLVTSSAGLAYATGTTYGYSNDNVGNGLNGMTRQDGGDIFSPVAVANGHTDTVTLTFTPDTWSNYYNLGTLKGVDSTQLSALINDYGRFMMQNANRGASTEQSVVQAEVPPLEMHWIAQLLEVFPDTTAVDAVKAGLNDISNYLVNSTTGQVSCCRPGTTDTWEGRFYYDQAPGFALGVADVYQQSGDTTWLTGIAPNVRLALDYEITNDTNATTHLVLNAHTTGGATTYQNNYWESTNGTYDGYTTALLYEALTKWAALESDVLGNSSNATYYSGIASTINTNFNLSLSSGGLWSPTTNTFFYGSGNADALYLPVNAEVLKTDLASSARRLAIVQAIETQDANGNYDVHPMNTMDLFTANQAAPTGSQTATKSGENGGWYGAPDGEFYAGLPTLKDPQRINSYVSSVLDRYGADGFYGGSTWDRDNWLTPLDTPQWFPTTAMPAWGLYYYQYGFQPSDNDLVLAPFISPNEVGSVVNWTWRGHAMSVTYNTQMNFTVAAPVMPTNIAIHFINQTSGTTYHVQVDGGTTYPVVADSNGVVDALFSSTNQGTHTFDCYDCTASSDAGSGSTSLVTSVSTSGSTLRNDVTQQVGVKISTGSSGAITAHQLGRYFVAGNSHVHTLKLLNANMQILATATVDESAGTADGLGFKYGSLDKPVTLQPNSTYYLYSLETEGGDQWYDYETVEATTSVASFASAAYGRTPTTIGGSGNSYCPLNIKY
jgi:hypothetical protein